MLKHKSTLITEDRFNSRALARRRNRIGELQISHVISPWLASLAVKVLVPTC